ncbi:hypothetical protein SADUNF_Sadunf18G0117100 [Salix dunnii]|uniref:Transducin/WD40 repeat-like superfamily protein n=1 Tax=Salix dunnii TaxID=1413687 RepID=A0A835J4N8_9ROSI|nr:hypothetical protein SADUNF_Sadunf18G0117100 [Salix dunnii]
MVSVSEDGAVDKSDQITEEQEEGREMLPLRAFRPSNDKIVKIHLHPTHPWLVNADASDSVVVWNWEHRQVIYEPKAGGVNERRLLRLRILACIVVEDGIKWMNYSKVPDASLLRAWIMNELTDHGQDAQELVPKLSLKAHDGGVVAVELSRVIGGAPQLITIGADKTLAIWDTISFKELRRIKPVPKLACHSVASWCHPRAPNLDILTSVKDSHMWAIENPTYSALTRPLCELSSLIPPQVLAPNKKLRSFSFFPISLMFLMDIQAEQYIRVSHHLDLYWYICAHALSLSHPGIRCRCLAAYGDAVSAVKWVSRLGREHHDDLAQFMTGMGYATEALHLPGISKRWEFDMAMQCNDLKRALQCLLTMSNSRDIGQDCIGLDLNDILSVNAKKENVVVAAQGTVKFANEFLDLIDAADATARVGIAIEALKRLAATGSVKGALQGHELRGLALRLANHGELTRLSGLVSNMISAGLGCEAAFSAAMLGDGSWTINTQELGSGLEQNAAEEAARTPFKKTDADAFLASLEEPKLASLAEAGKKPPLEILPPRMPSFSEALITQKKPMPGMQSSQQQPGKPLQLEAPPIATSGAVIASTATPITSAVPENASDATTTASATPENGPSSTTPEAGSSPLPSEATEPNVDDKTPTSSTESNSEQIAHAESTPATITSNVILPHLQAPSQIPDNQGASVPATTTLPVTDALG